MNAPAQTESQSSNTMRIQIVPHGFYGTNSLYAVPPEWTDLENNAQPKLINAFGTITRVLLERDGYGTYNVNIDEVRDIVTQYDNSLSLRLHYLTQFASDLQARPNEYPWALVPESIKAMGMTGSTSGIEEWLRNYGMFLRTIPKTNYISGIPEDKLVRIRESAQHELESLDDKSPWLIPLLYVTRLGLESVL